MARLDMENDAAGMRRMLRDGGDVHALTMREMSCGVRVESSVQTGWFIYPPIHHPSTVSGNNQRT